MNEAVRSRSRVQQFGDRHTVQKQSVVVKYLAAYATALRYKGFHLSYVDAFAGCGARIDAALRQQPQPSLFEPLTSSQPIDSTAIEAVRMQPGFHRYVFGDLNRRHLEALKIRVSSVSIGKNPKPDFVFVNSDANQVVQEECEWLKSNKMHRAVFFLDPYGMQVEWPSLQAIAASGKADLWLLIPTGIALNRLVAANGVRNPTWEARLNLFYGTSEWMDEFYEEQSDLVGTMVKRKIRETGIVDYTMKRLHSLFGDGLLNTPLPLKIKSRSSYHLIFACSSPNQVARDIAHRIARSNIIRSQAGN